jgi:cell division protein FtsN
LRCALALATLVALSSWMPATAIAQVGLGAERYEVTITPPKRPGSEGAGDAAQPEAGDAASPAPKDAAKQESATSPDAAGQVAPTGEAATGAPPAASPPSGGTAAVAAKEKTAPPAPSGPPHTLQVAAFRQKKSADSLRDDLAATFQDVTVLEVQSGGEPLYRVYVGHMPHGPALDDIRRRLVAAGHPAFEVPAPAGTPLP